MDPRRAAQLATTFEELYEDGKKPTTALLKIPLVDEHVVLRVGPSTAEQKHMVPLTETERKLYSALVKNLKPIKKATAAIEVDLVALQEEFKEQFDHTKFALISEPTNTLDSPARTPALSGSQKNRFFLIFDLT